MKVKEGSVRINKKRLLLIAAVTAAAAAGCVFIILWQVRQTAQDGSGSFPFGGDGGISMSGGIVASGVVSVGMTQEDFGVEDLETELVIEEVKITSGQEVAEGDALFSFAQDSVEKARKELEKKQRNAELDCRAGFIEYEQSKITAAYERDLAVLEGKQAEAIYRETVEGLEEGVDNARDALDEAQEQIEEYQKAMKEGSFYDYYKVGEYKGLYEENLKLLTTRMEEWGVDWSQVVSSGGGSQLEGAAAAAGNGTSGMNQGEESAGRETGAAASGLSSEGEAGNNTAGSAVVRLLTEGNTESAAAGRTAGIFDAITGGTAAARYLSAVSPREDDTGVSDGDADGQGTQQSAGQAGGQQSGGADGQGTQQSGGQAAAQDSAPANAVSVLKALYNVLEQNLKDYEQAQESCEDAETNAVFELQTLELNKSTLEKALAEAKEKYESQKLEAKLTMEASLAEAERADSDYETALQKAKVDYESLKQADEDARKNLALFEKCAGDGSYHALGSGTVLRTLVRSGQKLTSGSGVFLYSRPEELSVTVAVDQSQIARVALGDEAYIQSSGASGFRGTVTGIDPVSSSNGRTNVAYNVTVTLESGAENLSVNDTVTVILGLGESENDAE